MKFIHCCMTSLVLLVVSINAAEECTTPNKEKSTCVSIYECPILVEAIKSKDSTLLGFLRASQCAHSGRTPMVCCGTVANYTNTNEMLKSKRRLIPDRSICGYQHTDDRFNQQNRTTEIDEFPWLVQLRYRVGQNETLRAFCGGTLINYRYILTAAHCLKPKDVRTQLVSVRIGEYNTATGSDCAQTEYGPECIDPVQDIGIEEAIPYQLYDNHKYEYNDIALLRLNRTVRFTDYVRPICLPLPGSQVPQIGDRLILSGWGKEERGTNAEIKKKIVGLIITNEGCMEYYQRIVRLTKQHFCINETGDGDMSCRGDNGGPVMFSYRNQWQLEGVNSFGLLKCAAGSVSANTKVSEYIDWIIEHMHV